MRADDRQAETIGLPSSPCGIDNASRALRPTKAAIAGQQRSHAVGDDDYDDCIALLCHGLDPKGRFPRCGGRIVLLCVHGVRAMATADWPLASLLASGDTHGRVRKRPRGQLATLCCVIECNELRQHNRLRLSVCLLAVAYGSRQATASGQVRLGAHSRKFCLVRQLKLHQSG